MYLKHWILLCLQCSFWTLTQSLVQGGINQATLLKAILSFGTQSKKAGSVSHPVQSKFVHELAFLGRNPGHLALEIWAFSAQNEYRKGK